MNAPKFFRCSHCGNLYMAVEDRRVPVMCCGEKMQELNANTTDAAQEKHVPVIGVEGNIVKVKIGSAPHPMTEEHHIAWVWLQTDKTGHLQYLNHTGAPEAVFTIADDETVLEAYEYCNLHGLWKAQA